VFAATTPASLSRSLIHYTSSFQMVFVTADECRKILLAYQSKWLENLQMFAGWVGTERKVDLEYIIAQINNNDKCYTYVRH
jgi:hypothetical protein